MRELKKKKNVCRHIVFFRRFNVLKGVKKIKKNVRRHLDFGYGFCRKSYQTLKKKRLKKNRFNFL